MNSILDSNAPFKKLNKYKLRFKTKLWIPLALQKLISVKNSYIPKIPKQKDILILNIRLTEICEILVKKSKINYYNQYFKTNWDNTKNTRKRIQSIYFPFLY